MLKILTEFRCVCLAAALVSAALIATAYYMQYVMYLDPCPLCMVQRILIFIIGILCLGAFVHNPGAVGQRIYGTGFLIFSLLGVAAAGRHVWLQNLPTDRIPECFPGLEFIFQSHPLIDAIKVVLSGTGECAETLWTFLGISIPGWTLIVFIGFCITAVFVIMLSSVKRWQPNDSAV